MTFGEVFWRMTAGEKIRRKGWEGFWAWEDGTIKMHCGCGEALDVRQTNDPLFTFGNIAEVDWEFVDE